jgi:dTMP kinase
MTETQGYLIELEGGDGAGKRTQTELLRRRLIEAGWEVAVFSFPDDHTPFGNIIRESLHGQHGDFLHADPYRVAALYMADRGFRRDGIMAALVRGAIVILDRGPYSNFAYQGVKIPDRKERDLFQQWCERTEFDELQFPRPHLVLFMDIPADLGSDLVDRRGGMPDQHEIDQEFQKRVHDEFTYLASARGWRVVDCRGTETAIASREAIHNRLWIVVHMFLSA